MHLYPLSVVGAIPPPSKPAPSAVAASSGERGGEESGMRHVGVQDGVAALPSVTNATDLPSSDGMGKVCSAGVADAVAQGAVVAAGKDLFALTDT